MTYLTYGFGALTALWMIYLLIRCRKLRIPDRLGICCDADAVTGIMALGFGAIAVFAAQSRLEVVQLPLLVLSAGSQAALSLHVRNSMAFTADGFMICGLFGASKWYAWADVTDCRTMKTVVPRSNKPCYMYSLKLPDRDVALYDYKPDACAFINELRRHKPMMNIPVPGMKPSNYVCGQAADFCFAT